MRSYAQYCPVAKATEILGDRWTLLIVREMLGGASGFNELQRGLPGISRSVLTDRMRRYWMVLEPSEVSVCLQHPGFDVDLEVTVDTTTLYRVYLGRAELGGAIRAGQLTISGPRTLQRGFGHWFTWSAFAPASRSAQERRTTASRLASPHRVRIAEYGGPGTAPEWSQPPGLHPRASGDLG